MPVAGDIVLEDGTVWDGTDPEEPFLCRRLQFCERCRSIMSSRQQIRRLFATKLPRDEIHWICRAAEDGSFTCSSRGFAIVASERWNRGLVRSGDEEPHPDYTPRPIANPLKYKFFYGQNGEGPKAESTDLKKIRFTMVQNFMGNRQCLDFHIYASPDDPAAKHISTRPPMLDMGRDSPAQIRSWITNCCGEHETCPLPKDSSLPTRVIDVGLAGDGSDDAVVRIKETHGETGKYMALSYCWGPDEPGFLVKLVRDAYESMTGSHGIDVESLPRTIRDAVILARQLGVRYLWVDALCIIQDSRDDMVHELGQMASVYKNSYLTISAASAATCRDGFLHYRKPRRSAVPRFELPFRAWDESEGPAGTVVVQQTSHYYAYEEPLNKRAWCLQESLLSPRLVIFGTHELLWQCGQITHEEPLVAGGPGDFYVQGVERLDAAFFDPTRTISTQYWQYSWEDVTVNYSQRLMTFEEDKLLALSALATEHQRLSGGDEYVAGLWRRDLIRWLTWIVDPSYSADRVKGYQQLNPRPSVYVAPSWSWASTRGILCWSSGKPAGAEVIRCEVALRDASLPMGAIKSAELELLVQIKKARWSGQTLFDGTEIDSQPVGKVFMDAVEERPETVSCLRLYDMGGIVVAPNSPTTYVRLGKWEIHRLESANLFFADCEMSNIILV